ncbi:MAG TPA: hypothetical protein ENJ66_00770 [Calditrichae bacterium]|nr:hypothetical protein [Calditrichia bacterium]
MKTRAENLIGIRQYLNSPNSFQDLRQLVELWQNQPAHTKKRFTTAVALCGKNPSPFLTAEGIADAVKIYDYSALRLSPTQLIKRLIFDYQPDERVQIIYYSTFPEGLTYPVDLFTQMAVFLSYKNLAVSDSDFQIPFEELLRSFEFHIQKNNIQAPLVTFPKRKRRSLDAQDYPINRWAMEDIENLYVYFLSNIRFLDMKLDIQSGLFFTNHIANMHLDFERVGKWVGTLHLAISLLRHPDVQVEQIVVDTNIQEDSTISFAVQCSKINELYDYYLIPMENIIRIALDNPRKYLMDDWTQNLSTEEIQQTLENIFQAYLQFKSRSAV